MVLKVLEDWTVTGPKRSAIKHLSTDCAQGTLVLIATYTQLVGSVEAQQSLAKSSLFPHVQSV